MNGITYVVQQPTVRIYGEFNNLQEAEDFRDPMETAFEIEFHTSEGIYNNEYSALMSINGFDSPEEEYQYLKAEGSFDTGGAFEGMEHLIRPQ